MLASVGVWAANFDADVVSGVSATITEGKTLADHTPSPATHPAAKSRASEGYVSSSVLTPFTDDSSWQSDIIGWRWSQTSKLGLDYANQLTKNPWPGVATSIGSSLARQTLGDLYYTGSSRLDVFSYWNLGRTYNELGRVFATSLGNPYYNTVGDAFRLDKNIYSATNNVLFTTISAASLFNKMITYAGTSMQIMNPPIYLQHQTPTGWMGVGTYNIGSSQVTYKETLFTAKPDAIIRDHADRVIINTPTTQGVSWTQTVTNVPVADGLTGRFERYLNYHFPTGSYWDVNGTQTTVTKTSTIIQETIMGGYRVDSQTTSLPNLPSKFPTGSYWTPTPYGTYTYPIKNTFGTYNINKTYNINTTIMVPKIGSKW